MGSLENYDLWDLTKEDTLSYTIKDSIGVAHSVGYKIVNNATVLQFPDNENNVAVQFKISKLTADELKLILLISYTYEGKIKDEDVIILVFEVENK